jgi:hypothetical protein
MLDFSSPPKAQQDASQFAIKRKLLEDRLLKKTVQPTKKKDFTKEELADRKRQLLKVSR